MEVYFDNSATTRVLDEVKDLTVKLTEIPLPATEREWRQSSM